MQIPQLPPDPEMAASGRRWTYRGIISLLVFGGLAVIGWQWRSGVTISSIEVRDSCESSWFTSTPGCVAIMADSAAITEMIGIEPGGPLYEVDASVVVNRVMRHPWVSSVHVDRTPGGKLIVEVRPREATLLAMRQGQPSYFVDAEGYRMPFVEGVAYDVPLLHGLDEDYKKLEPVRNEQVRRLAAMMEDLDPQIDALISEVEISPGEDMVIHTTPAGALPSIEVIVESDDLEDQLYTLRAYWDQVLLASADTRIRQIDLRFDSRIITR